MRLRIKAFFDRNCNWLFNKKLCLKINFGKPNPYNYNVIVTASEETSIRCLGKDKFKNITK